MPVWCLAYSSGIPKLTIRVRGISGPQKMRVRGISGPQMAVSRADGNYYKYELSVLHQLPVTNLGLLIYGCMCVGMYTRTHT